MANQTVEQEQVGSDSAQQQDFLKEADAIIAACHTLMAEHGETLEQLKQAQRTKESTRQGYEAALDRGDEAAMKKSLAGIRQVNSDIEVLQKRLSDFPQKTDSLRGRHAALRDRVKHLGPKAKASLDQAKKDFQQAEHVLCHCNQGVQSELNAVANAIETSSTPA